MESDEEEQLSVMSPSPDIRPGGEASEEWESSDGWDSVSSDAAGAFSESDSQVQHLRDIRPH